MKKKKVKKKEDKFEICRYCNKVFTPLKPNQKICPECRETFSNMRASGDKAKKPGDYEKPSLNENIAAAKAAGLSYGQYKALLLPGSRVVI